MSQIGTANTGKQCRSRKGAWIEIISKRQLIWKKSCRSRKGAWIEITVIAYGQKDIDVAPVRERGLKCFKAERYAAGYGSLP